MDNNTGKPDVSQIEPESRGVYQGNGWMYNENSDALMLKSGTYDFNYTSPGYRTGDHLNCVNVTHILVQLDATIVGGMFNGQSLLNHGTVKNSLLGSYDIINEGGTMTDCLFSRTTPPVDVANCHKLTEVNNSIFNATLLNAPSGFTGCETYYFTGTPTLTVKVDNNPIQYINGEEHYGGLKPSEDVSGYYTFTPKAGEDVVLNRKPYVTDLVMTPGGFLDTTGREPIYDSAKNVIGCKGKGWKYENGTLTLESGEYDFTHTEPRNTASSRYGDSVKCNIVVEENAEITGGILAGNSLTNSGTVKDILFMGYWLTNNNGTLSCLLGPSVYDHPSFTRHTVKAVDGSEIYYTVNQQSTGNGKQLYFTGTPKFTVKLEDSDILCINGDKYYGGLKPSEPSEPSDVHGYYTFTPPVEENIVLNREPYVTDLVITEGGIPDSTNREPVYEDGKVVGYKGNGWKYENGTLTLESGKYDFSKDGLGQLAPDVNLVVTGATLTGGAFNEIPHGLTADNVQPIILNGSGSIEAVNDLSSAKWNTTLYAIKDSQVEIKADTDITNINGWDIGKFPGGSSYPNGEDDKKTVRFRMPDGPVVLNDTLYTLDIIRGNTLGNTSVAVPAGTELKLDADEPAKNETFLGWTLSDESLLTKGTLNDPNCKTITITMKNASATAEAVFQKDTPAYTLTVTGGGLVNDKTSAVVEAGDEVCLTVGEMQEGMSFNYWDLPTALIKALMDKDSTFSNKVESLTFTMPDLSEYTEDKSFTIRLDIRPAELPDDDDGPSVLGTMATVAVGGAAAGILVWQGVSLGVDSYLQLSLPDGVAVPTNRRELVKLLWETAGKPDVVLPALYGDVSAEDAELQKATRWAIDNGLVKSADETDASRFDPDRSVSKYEVARAWFKVQQMLK